MIKLSLFFFILNFALPSMAYDEYTKQKQQQQDEERRRQNEEVFKTQRLLKHSEVMLDEDKDLLVEVEPSNIMPGDLSNAYVLVPYAVRRNDWGIHFNISYGMYEPINYESDYISSTVADYDTLYGAADLGLIEIGMNFKRNLDLGSLGGELYVGQYTNTSDADILSADLSLMILRAGAKLTLDNFGAEPYFAPYLAGGVYVVQFNEVNGDKTFTGNTSPAFYYAIGGLFQIDWIDKAAAREAYFESGIENTFVFLEVRQFLGSQEASDPDFSSDIHLDAGLTVEF